MANLNPQVTDQTIKGTAVGAIAYFLAKFNIDPGAQAAIMPVLITGLAWLSTKIGDPTQASFLAKASEELPDLVEEVTVAVEAEKSKKAPAKKAPAKKAAPKTVK